MASNANEGNNRSLADTDIVDEGIAKWQAERPDIDSSAKAVVGRVVRLEDRILQIVNPALRPFGLKYPSYSVLVTLRVNGEPFEMSPKLLKHSLLLTSGGLSTLLERIEQRGLIERLPDPNDRRGVIVRLTSKGRELADRAMVVHAQVEHQIIAGLSKEEQSLLAKMLGKLLRHLSKPVR